MGYSTLKPLEFRADELFQIFMFDNVLVLIFYPELFFIYGVSHYVEDIARRRVSQPARMADMSFGDARTICKKSL